MKIRTCFVSNSSSSSCVIIGKRINYKDVLQIMAEGRDVYVLGDYLCDGSDLFKLTEEMANAAKRNRWDIGAASFWEVYEYGEEISLENAPRDMVAFGMELDYHTTEGLDEFNRRYIDNNEDSW